MRRIKKEFIYSFYAVAALFLSYAALMFLLNTETPVVVVSSGSMEPVISAGDVLFVRGTDLSGLAIGDVVVYVCPAERELCVRDNELIAHRIVEITELGMKTKGDANERADRWLVRFAWLNGRVFFRVPYAGLPIVWFKNIMQII